MFENLTFYIRHSFNDLRVNGQRTFFALLCIAAGVAAIVSLQTLAVMISDTLTGNLQRNNRGDIAAQVVSVFGMDGSNETMTAAVDAGDLTLEESSIFGQSSSDYYLTAQGVDTIRTWLNERYPGQVEITPRYALMNPFSALFGGGEASSLTVADTGAQVSSAIPVMIDSAVYPYYDATVSEDGTPLADLLREPTDLVLSRRVANDLGADVGAVLRIGGTTTDFTVRGITPDEAEVKNIAGNDMFTALFGYYYVDARSLPLFEGVPVKIDTLYFRIANPTPDLVLEIESAVSGRFGYLNTTTTENLRSNYEVLSENINTLVSVMGLLSMLIGSIGIVNTMQVIVRRRTVEVAVLKTIGMQAGQVTRLFLVEAVLMGIIGSLAGIVLGWGAVFIVRGAAERLLATELPFQIAPVPALIGFLVGVIVTTVFGFLPTLTAGQVRPGVVLRPNDNIIPKAGCVSTLLALLVIVGVLTLIATPIVNNIGIAFAVVVGAFVAAGFLYLALNVLIWLFGRLFPSFGIVDLRISLRQMRAGRSRAAVTLLALVVGVFSLSTITLMADSITSLLRVSLEEQSGGNVYISVPTTLMLGGVENALNNVEGVSSYSVVRSYQMQVVSLFDHETGETLTPEQVAERMDLSSVRFFSSDDEGNVEEMSGEEARSAGMQGFNDVDMFQRLVGSVDMLAPQSLPDRPLASGRALTAEDFGQPYLIIQETPMLASVGLTPGDRITYSIQSGGILGQGGEAQEVTLEIVGVTSRGAMSASFTSSNYMIEGALPESIGPTSVSVTANVAPESLPELRRELSGMLGVFVIETAFLTNLISTLLGTFTAFPTMVALLGLIVGGVVIANSVALTTMERRREIAVMKSVGLQRERVLAMILLENGILGLIGGLIGVGFGLVALIIFATTSQVPLSALPYGTALLLMGLCIAVALIAALSSAWSASGEKPLNVLRYE
ncbi:MAG: FtsX-like permease family protein [Anaerolineae bacterium]|nr:FtsX-like permease family protein [Anaerolineae bacterium]